MFYRKIFMTFFVVAIFFHFLSKNILFLTCTTYAPILYIQKVCITYECFSVLLFLSFFLVLPFGSCLESVSVCYAKYCSMRYEQTKRIILRALIFGFRFTIFGFVTTLQSLFHFICVRFHCDYYWLCLFAYLAQIVVSLFQFKKKKQNIFVSFVFLPLFSLLSLQHFFFSYVLWIIFKVNMYNNW